MNWTHVIVRASALVGLAMSFAACSVAPAEESSGQTEEALGVASAQPVYRLFNGAYAGGDHLLTTNPYEGTNAGWHFEKVAFYTANASPNVCFAGLQRCSDRYSGKHFLSTDYGCEGHVFQATLGYYCFYPWANSGVAAPMKQLTRYHNPWTWDRLSTTNDAEKQNLVNAGWQKDYDMGWVPSED